MAKTVADTPLATWLNRRMAEWTDPLTGDMGLSLNALAGKSGVSQTMLWEIVKTGAIPKAEILTTLAGFFEVSPLVLFRLAYLPESESDDFDPGVKVKLLELEEIVGGIPQHAQVQFLESLISQAKMLQVAISQWEREASER